MIDFHFSIFMGKPFRNASVEFMKVTPSLMLKNFHMGPPAMLHKGEPDEAASARGPIAIESKKGGQDFYRALFYTLGKPL